MINFTSASPGPHGPIGLTTGAVVGCTGEDVVGVTDVVGVLMGADVGWLTGDSVCGSGYNLP